jgi:chromosome segregation ATPase
MKRDRERSLLKRFTTQRKVPDSAPAEGALPERRSILAQQSAAGQKPLHGADLEQAYRELLVEVQMLRQHNVELGVALERQGLEQNNAAATDQLIRAQRSALAERSHRMREAEFENKKLVRAQKKIEADYQQLHAQLERHVKQVQMLQQRYHACSNELRDTRAELASKQGELEAMTDRYYQLESAIEKFSVPHGSVANG